MLPSQLSPHRGTGELQASTAQLRSIIGALPDAAFVVDQEGLVCFVNPAALDLFNLPAVALLEKPFAFSLSPGKVKQIQITRPRIKNVIAEMRTVETKWSGQNAHLVLLRDVSERVATGQALEESEKRSQVLLHAFPDTIYLLNREGEYVGYQVHDSKLLFAPPSKFLGRKLSDVFSVEHMRILQPAFDAALRTGKPQTLEYLLEVKGETHYFEERLVSYDKENVLSLVRDITERKKMEETSRRYSATLWAISFAAGEFMEDGYSDTTIQNMLERLGRASEVSRVYIFRNQYQNGKPESYKLQYEWVAEGVRPRLGNSDLEEFPMISMLSTSLSNGKVVVGQVSEFDEEERKRLEQQEIKSILSVPIFEGEKWWGFIGFNECLLERDFSEIEIGSLRTAAGILSAAIQHMTIDRALHESEERYRGIVEDQMDFISRWCPDDMTITFVNNAFCRFFGGSREDWIGKNVQDTILPDDVPDAFTYGQQLGPDMSIGIHEHRNMNSQGELRWCQWRDRAILDEDGQIFEVQSVGRDIHESKLRAREQEGIAVIAAALRGIPTRLETLRVIVDKLLDLLDASGVAVAFHDEDMNDALTFELGAGELNDLVGKTLCAEDIWKESCIHPGKTYHNNDELDHEKVRQYALDGSVWAGVLVPLVVEAQPIGAMLVVNRRKITEDEERTLKAVADIAASAVHRATLYENTQRRLDRVTALRTLNLAVCGNIDLKILLEVLMDQITEHLGVDAADVLVLNPETQELLYTLGRGFWTKAIEDIYLNLSSGLAGQAVLERQMVLVKNLTEDSRVHPEWREMAQKEKFNSYLALPLIAKGQVKGVLEIFSRQKDGHDEEWLGFMEALAADAAMAIDHAELFGELQRSNEELTVAYDATIWGWSKALELRDKETQGHSERVVELTVRLARLLGVLESDLPAVRRGAILHDIGKMGVPDSILLKPGPLEPGERDIMRRHPEFAYQMLSAIPFLQGALDIPYCHHERWNGKGYPRRLQGEDIPLAARIFSVVDVWDALTSDRPYRRAWSREKTYEYIKAQRGRAFDPRVVDVFLKLMDGEKDRW
ncbi:MAG: GAF domain-containing protein [Anaerolineaceae bacterium]|nr:GAF domain-containing protein [Anaerolineaceae bacterium]